MFVNCCYEVYIMKMIPGSFLQINWVNMVTVETWKHVLAYLFVSSPHLNLTSLNMNCDFWFSCLGTCGTYLLIMVIWKGLMLFLYILFYMSWNCWIDFVSIEKLTPQSFSSNFYKQEILLWSPFHCWWHYYDIFCFSDYEKEFGYLVILD